LRRIEIRPGWDVVFIIRRAIDAAEFSAIEKEVRTLLDSIRLLLDDNEKDCPGLS
jgi:RNase P protein component